MVDSIAEILPTIPLMERLSNCERCGRRPKFEAKRWCSVCINGYRIEENNTLFGLIRDTIPPLYHNARTQDLKERLCNIFLNGILKEWQGIMFWGKQGRGKTYAMMAFAIGYLNEGFTVECVNYDLLCSRIRSSYQPKAKETEYDIVQSFCKPDKLFIDDVGVTVTGDKMETDFSLRVFLSIIDQRINHMKPTFITTNKPLEQLEASFDKRISSRLKQCCHILQITGEDRRGK